MAWPDFDRRATITTVPAPDSFLDGIGLVESSSWNVKGKSFFVARTIATGMGGPLISRANTNNVSVADPLPARLGARVTVPLIARDCPVCPVGLAGTDWFRIRGHRLLTAAKLALGFCDGSHSLLRHLRIYVRRKVRASLLPVLGRIAHNSFG